MKKATKKPTKLNLGLETIQDLQSLSRVTGGGSIAPAAVGSGGCISYSQISYTQISYISYVQNPSGG